VDGGPQEARDLVGDGAGLVLEDYTFEEGGEERFCGAWQVLDHLHREREVF
jgi:hypothetical protein